MFQLQSSGIRILDTEVLSANWYTLRKVTYSYFRKDGSQATVSREAYDRGNEATILLYNTELRKVILTWQFRLRTFINGNETNNSYFKKNKNINILLVIFGFTRRQFPALKSLKQI